MAACGFKARSLRFAKAFCGQKDHPPGIESNRRLEATLRMTTSSSTVLPDSPTRRPYSDWHSATSSSNSTATRPSDTADSDTADSDTADSDTADSDTADSGTADSDTVARKAIG